MLYACCHPYLDSTIYSSIILVTMIFVFVDETGDLGKRGSPYFGMALLEVHSDSYKSIESVVSTYRVLSGMFAELKESPQQHFVGLNLLRGITSLAEAKIIEVSGLYINKSQYGGRYLTWSDYGIPKSRWAYYIRNYLLRHLLEFHFTNKSTSDGKIDLILDRISLTELQRVNTLSYLNSETEIPLKQPFSMPHIGYLTIADSKYVGCLQVVHMLADLVNGSANNKVSKEQLGLMNKFFRIKEFIGHKKPVEKLIEENGHPTDGHSPLN